MGKGNKWKKWQTIWGTQRNGRERDRNEKKVVRNCTNATGKMKDTPEEGRISPVWCTAITQVLGLLERNEWRSSRGCQ